jgi:hypothetical protein
MAPRGREAIARYSTIDWNRHGRSLLSGFTLPAAEPHRQRVMVDGFERGIEEYARGWDIPTEMVMA